MANTGFVRMYAASGDGGGVTASIFYDNTLGVNADGTIDFAAQPIIETGTGNQRAAMLVENTTGGVAEVIVTGPTGTDVYKVPSGTTRVRLAQLQARGINTRADLVGFSLASP